MLKDRKFSKCSAKGSSEEQESQFWRIVLGGGELFFHAVKDRDLNFRW